MAQTIPYPWILKYLLEVAEEYGADLSIVPRKDKGAKSQLVKVRLRFGRVVVEVISTTLSS